ncbi:hypothetical protein B4U79_09574 [Dinothrombium tinctorium]|uniref:Peptidase M28 domain-containing protein n=2 Tax=Dinothrombium tinctorium TaxID=1965070 RepID=A0A3S3SGK9_9ACAR|nr:hypothetical protein B4U79_09574 [Dinothrombium tinctorium]
MVIGAHYDTVINSPGVNDNGSGCVATLEIARILSAFKGKLSASVYFVFFDEEEKGTRGSKVFVRNYLLPKVLHKKSKFIAALILDMVMAFDAKPNTQTLPSDVIEFCPYAVDWMRSNSNRGNFIAVFARSNVDSFIWQTLLDAWNAEQNTNFDLLPLDAPIPENRSYLNSRHRSSSFFRSDHLEFWLAPVNYYNFTALPAVQLWDLGVWRSQMKQCYHKACDDLANMKPENLQFLAYIIKSVTKAVIKLIEKS